MMEKTPRTRYFELITAIQRSTTHEVGMFVELVGIALEESRTRLVNADGNDMLRAQGESRRLERLYKDLTQPSPVKETM